MEIYEERSALTMTAEKTGWSGKSAVSQVVGMIRWLGIYGGRGDLVEWLKRRMGNRQSW